MTKVFALADDEVHLWKFSLTSNEIRREDIVKLLSLDEIERAEAFLSATVRDQFIMGRGTLRLILSEYLAIPAAEIQFVYGPFGKPELHNAGIAFNLSHSGNLALLAVTRAAQVGVDLEQLRPLDGADSIAASNFTARELDAYRQTAPELRNLALLKILTCKEALLKASGEGLTVPLNVIDVALTQSLKLIDISVENGYVASLAVSGEPRILVRNWTSN